MTEERARMHRRIGEITRADLPYDVVCNSGNENIWNIVRKPSVERKD